MTKKPIIVICTFERVGSTWFMNFIDKVGRRQTEPFRQHLGEGSPFCTINRFQRKITLPFFHESLRSDPYPQIWHKNYLSCVKSPNFIAKETNLFFILGSFLDHYPKDSKIVLLSRNLFGIISSFKKKNLYRSWDYLDRYLSLKQIISSNPELSSFQPLINATNKNNWLEVLTTMFVINCLEIDRFLFQDPSSNNIEKISYEDLISKKNTVLKHLKKYLEFDKPISQSQENKEVKSTSPFNVFQKKDTSEDWKEILSRSDIDEIFDHVQKITPLIKKYFSPRILDHLFELGLPIERPIIENIKIIPLSHKKTEFSLTKIPRLKPKIDYLNNIDGLSISIPITNTQYCQFLNWLWSNGFSNEIHGYYLFYNPNMSAARGGRIFFANNNYKVLSGYEDHPVNWVTWIGAYLFSRWVNTRLPLESELITISKKQIRGTINRDFVVGDTSRIIISKEVDYLIGNVKTWCSDWYYPDGIKSKFGGIFKTVYGHAWNSSSSSSLTTYKPFLISARSIGIRLIKDKVFHDLKPEQLKNFYNTIEDQAILNLPTPEINQKIIDSLK